jgi:hypothetical protein
MAGAARETSRAAAARKRIVVILSAWSTPND